MLKENIFPIAGCAACCCVGEVDGLCFAWEGLERLPDASAGRGVGVSIEMTKCSEESALWE